MLQRVALGFPCWIMREQQHAKCLEQSLLLSFLCSVLPLETSDYCILIPPMWSSLWEGEIAHSLYIRKVRSKQTSFWNLAFLLGVGIKGNLPWKACFGLMGFYICPHPWFPSHVPPPHQNEAPETLAWLEHQSWRSQWPLPFLQCCHYWCLTFTLHSTVFQSHLKVLSHLILPITCKVVGQVLPSPPNR